MSRPVRVRARRWPDCEELSSAVQQGRGRASGGSGGAEPRGPDVFGPGPARFGTAEQTDPPASASAIPVVSAAGGAGESHRAAANRTGNVVHSLSAP